MTAQSFSTKFLRESREAASEYKAAVEEANDELRELPVTSTSFRSVTRSDGSTIRRSPVPPSNGQQPRSPRPVARSIQPVPEDHAYMPYSPWSRPPKTRPHEPQIRRGSSGRK